MKQYRLKKEAVPFILEKHATKIYPYDTWQSLGIDLKALEEVEPIYISFGIKTSDNSSSLCGWSEKDGSHFEFTINFPNVKFEEHDKFSKGRISRDLMNKIQDNLDSFFIDFINETNELNEDTR